MKIVDDVRSVVAAFRASAILGRGFRARDRGDAARACHHAQQGLTLLRSPYVRRRRPAEGSVLACLTVLAEEVRENSNSSGASQQDLADSIAILKETHTDLSASLPLLEKRLDSFARDSTGAASSSSSAS